MSGEFYCKLILSLKKTEKKYLCYLRPLRELNTFSYVSAVSKLILSLSKKKKKKKKEYIYRSLCLLVLSISVFLSLSVYPSVCLSVSLCVCLSVSLSLSVTLSTYLSIYRNPSRIFCLGICASRQVNKFRWVKIVSMGVKP